MLLISALDISKLDLSKVRYEMPRQKQERTQVCMTCCPASEWYWLRWVLLAQPLFALLIYLWAY